MNQRITDLEDAAKVLVNARYDVATTNEVAWLILRHAYDHIQRQFGEIAAEVTQ